MGHLQRLHQGRRRQGRQRAYTESQDKNNSNNMWNKCMKEQESKAEN